MSTIASLIRRIANLSPRDVLLDRDPWAWIALQEWIAAASDDDDESRREQNDWRGI